MSVIAAAVMWASSGTASKALFMSGVKPFQLVQIRVTLSALILALVLGLFARRLLKIRLIDAAYFCFLGGVLLALGSRDVPLHNKQDAGSCCHPASIYRSLDSGRLLHMLLGRAAHHSQDCCHFLVASRLLPRGGGIQPGTIENESCGHADRLGFSNIVCCIQSHRGTRDAPARTVDCRVLCFRLCRRHLECPSRAFPFHEIRILRSPVGLHALHRYRGYASPIRPVF